MMEKCLKEHLDCFHKLSDLTSVIDQNGLKMAATIKKGGKILICGNGGSAADAQHFSAELVGRFYKNRKAIPSIALTTDTSIITATANDFGYKNIFSRQVEALGYPEDLLIAISTSGNSENILEAVLAGRKKKMVTIALTGADGGELREQVDCWIGAPSRQTPRIQEAHIFILHTWAEQIEKTLLDGNELL